MTARTRLWIFVYLLSLVAMIIVAHGLLQKSAIGVNIAETRWGLNLHHYSDFMALLPRSTAASLERTLNENAASAIDSPRLSHPSGVYPDGVSVSVSLPQNARGYFSLDGSIPTIRHHPV